jgi:hypothetical protein
MKFELRREVQEAIESRLVPACESQGSLYISQARATAYIAASMVENDQYSKNP